MQRIDWEVRYDPDVGVGWLASHVTLSGRAPTGGGFSGEGARLDDGVDAILVSMADLAQDQIARCGTAWPWGDDGGFMTSVLEDGVAVWRDRNGRSVRIGSLAAT